MQYRLGSSVCVMMVQGVAPVEDVDGEGVYGDNNDAKGPFGGTHFAGVDVCVVVDG